MKKFFVLLSFMCLSFSPLFIQLDAAGSSIKYVTTSLGETITDMQINYQTNESSSYIIYATDPSLSGGTRVDAEHTPWVYEIEAETYGFDAREIARVALSDLRIDTNYYYQVTAGTAKSDIYSFKTANGRTGANFAFVTDSQASGAQYGRVNGMMEKLLEKNQQITFMLMAGDIVDRGGQESQWSSFYEHVTVTKQLPFATIPGNHEYYLSPSGDYISPEVYNQFFYNPQNGPEVRLNSTYYFQYNEILFIMLDTIQAKYFDEQRAWFDEVVLNNPSRYIIVVMHSGLYGAANYASAAQVNMREWGSLFEAHSVDLVLSGHEHLFAYTEPLTNGQVDRDFGVTYMIHPAGGPKQYAIWAQYEDDFVYAQNINYAGSVVQATATQLTLTLYNEDGVEQHKTTVASRRKAINLTENYKFKYKIEHDEVNNKAKLTWKEEAFGNVRKITVTNDNGLNVTKILSTPLVRELSLGAVWEGNEYTYNIKVYLASGEVVEETATWPEKKTTKPTQPTQPGVGCNFGTSTISLLLLPLALLLRKRKQD